LDRGFKVDVEEDKRWVRQYVTVNAAAYADDLMFYSERGDWMRELLDLLSQFYDYTAMKVTVKECVALAGIWE
jgi:hypothetical protein